MPPLPPTTVAARNLSRLLTRLDHKLASPQPHNDCAKIAANLEYVRQLLHALYIGGHARDVAAPPKIAGCPARRHPSAQRGPADRGPA